VKKFFGGNKIQNAIVILILILFKHTCKGNSLQNDLYQIKLHDKSMFENKIQISFLLEFILWFLKEIFWKPKFYFILCK
jgi:hypothetical protein